MCLSAVHAVRYSIFLLIGLSATHAFSVVAPTATSVSPKSAMDTNTRLMAQYRGLEQRVEGATPTEGGMTLYMKAGPDGESVGDCPFAHFVRMVLEEKGLDYEVRPSTQETKPQWLIDYYDGKMPALRHRRECYVESDVIAEYLDFFFPQPPLQGAPKDVMEAAEQAVEGFFPAFAKYAKHTPDGDDQDIELRDNLKETLRKLESHLNKNGPFIAGESISLVDCGLTPKLYHMQTCLAAFKGNSIDIKTEFPKLSVYMDTMFARDSFQKTVYGVDVVEWGWSNARK